MKRILAALIALSFAAAPVLACKGEGGKQAGGKQDSGSKTKSADTGKDKKSKA